MWTVGRCDLVEACVTMGLKNVVELVRVRASRTQWYWSSGGGCTLLTIVIGTVSGGVDERYGCLSKKRTVVRLDK